MGVGGDNSKYLVQLTLVPLNGNPGSNLIAGLYDVRILKNGIVCTGSIPRIVVLPGPLAVSQSTIPSTVPGTAGVQTTFLVYFRDAYSQPITTNKFPFNYNLAFTIPTTPTPTSAAVSWNNAAGAWSFQYTLTLAVQLLGSLTKDGNSLFAIQTVTSPNAINAAHCQATGYYNIDLANNGLTQATVLVGATFFLYAYDLYNNPVAPSAPYNSPFVVIISSGDSTSVQYLTPSPPGQPFTNKFVGSWTPSVSGSFSVSVTYGGVHIGTALGAVGTIASPYTLTVQPGVISAANTRVTVDPTPLAAGSQLTFLVACKDGTGGPWQSGNTLGLFGTIQLPPTSQQSQGNVVDLTVTTGPGPGQYYMSLPLIDPNSAFNTPYTAQTGTYTVLSITVTNAPNFGVTTIPMTAPQLVSGNVVTVVGGPPSGPKTRFLSPTSVTYPVSTLFTARIQLFDQFDNSITSSPPASAITAYVQAGSQPTCAINQNGDSSGTQQVNGAVNPNNAFAAPIITSMGGGIYTIDLTGSKTGNYYLNTSVNGDSMSCLTCLGQSITIVAGPANGGTSYCSGGGILSGAPANPAGVPIPFDCTVQDSLNNLRMALGQDTIELGVVDGGTDVSIYGLNPSVATWATVGSNCAQLTIRMLRTHLPTGIPLITASSIASVPARIRWC